MSKKKSIILILVLIVVIFAVVKLLDKPEEFQVEDVMFDRGGAEI